MIMKIYLISLAAGILMGLIYSLIDVRSPAPPAVALLGLLGMLIGGQILPFTKQVLRNEFSVTWFSQECAPKITGVTPVAPKKKDDA
jgi:XapX domain-containing protein